MGFTSAPASLVTDDISQSGERVERNESSCNVLVVAKNRLDAGVLCDLLTRAGFMPRWEKEVSVTTNAHLVDYKGTVICHRQNPSGTNSTIELSSLPLPLRHKRVVVVSDATDEAVVIKFLEEGAHQCFNLNQSQTTLTARLEAAFRQHRHESTDSFTQGDIRFDLQTRRVTRAGEYIDLSPKEYEFAYYLFVNRGRIVATSELLTSIWSLPASMDTRRIDTAACRVRKKLRLNASDGWELNRIRRVGYRLIKVEQEYQIGGSQLELEVANG